MTNDNQQVEVVFWGTRSYDVRLASTVDKKDLDTALEKIGDNNPMEVVLFLENIGYEFEVDDMSPIDESITDMDVFYHG